LLRIIDVSLSLVALRWSLLVLAKSLWQMSALDPSPGVLTPFNRLAEGEGRRATRTATGVGIAVVDHGQPAVRADLHRHDRRQDPDGLRRPALLPVPLAAAAQSALHGQEDVGRVARVAMHRHQRAGHLRRWVAGDDACRIVGCLPGQPQRVARLHDGGRVVDLEPKLVCAAQLDWQFRGSRERVARRDGSTLTSPVVDGSWVSEPAGGTEVHVVVDGPVLRLTLDRPEAANALAAATSGALLAALDRPWTAARSG
jgi:hypothetical protein